MRKKLVITMALLSIVIMIIIPTNSVWAGKESEDEDKDDDDDDSDSSYRYKYKFDEDGSFNYKYEFDFGDDDDDEKYFTEQRAYEIGYQDGQVHRISNLPFNPMTWLHFEGKKLVNAYEDGYKDGYFSNDNVIRY